VHWLLALDALAAAVTIMLSGYYRGGLLALGLAAAIAGAAVGSFAARQKHARPSVGMSIVGIFAVVLAGRFFGSLPTGLALGLVLAPLLAWTAELPGPRRLAPGWRNLIRFACVAVPLVTIVLIARQNFLTASTARSPSVTTPVRAAD
jgi:hypothetical protein